MAYLNHITLATGQTRRSPRSEVSEGVIETLGPWLHSAIDAKEAYPLPGALGQSEGFAARVAIEYGALLCTVSQEHSGPLVTFGVADRSQQSGELWALLCADFGSANALLAPSTPWCAVAIHPPLALHPDASEWLGDFECCVAWTWLERAA